MYQIGTLLLSEKVDARNDSVGHTDELWRVLQTFKTVQLNIHMLLQLICFFYVFVFIYIVNACVWWMHKEHLTENTSLRISLF